MSDVQIVVRTEGRDERRTVTTGTTAADLFGDDREVVVARVNDVLRDLAHELADGDVVEPVGVEQRGRPQRAAALRRARARPGRAGGQPEGTPRHRAADPGRLLLRLRRRRARSPPRTSRPLEKGMARIVKEGQTFRRRVVTDDDAREELADEPYKLELIGLKGGPSGARVRGRRRLDLRGRGGGGRRGRLRRGRRRRADDLRQPAPGRLGRLEGPLPRPAPAVHPAARQRLPADALARPRTGGAARRTRSCSASTARPGRARTT